MSILPCDDYEIVFVLVEPARPENVGAAARAMKTMGFSSLWLVNPCEIHGAAQWVAHQSGSILEHAKLFTSLDGALANVDFSIATTARRRLVRDRYLLPEQCATVIKGKAFAAKRFAIVFGRESSGLTNEEIALCDAISSLPMNQPQPSLNLAQAVMLYAWEISKAGHPCDHLHHSEQSWQHARRTIGSVLQLLDVASSENLHQWVTEALVHCDDRDLGMLMQLCKRVTHKLR